MSGAVRRTTAKRQESAVNGRWFAFVLAVPLALLPMMTYTDPDLWGHVRFGQDLLRERHLTYVDPYSFTQDTPWINHEWMHELLSGLSYNVAGSAGLIVLKAVLVITTLAVMGHALSQVSLPIQWSVFAFGVIGSLPLFVMVRPQLWTGLFVAIVCHILTVRRGWLILPFLFAAWANLHGGWIVGAVVLLVWTATALVWDRPALRGWVLPLFVASAAATLLTPYGTTLWRFLAATAHGSRDIAEWLPLWTKPAIFWIPWLLSELLVAGALWYGGAASIPIISVVFALAVGGIWISRIAALAIIANIVVAGPALARRWPIRNHERHLGRWGPPSLVAILLVVAILIAVPTARCITTAGDWIPDDTAAEILRVNGAKGRLVTEFGWGEYVIWHLAPNLKTSIDGRRETVYTDKTVREQIGIEEGSPEGLDTLARLRPEYVWLRAASAPVTRAWLVQHGYRFDVDRSRSFVAVRNDLPRLESVPVIERGCFPGP